jgi:hypothetical protein
MRAAARQAFDKGALSVKVQAHTGRDASTIESPVATLTFAPYGMWDKTDRVYFLGDYKAVIRHHSPQAAADPPPRRIAPSPSAAAPSRVGSPVKPREARDTTLKSAVSINTLLPVPDGFESAAKIVEVTDLDLPRGVGASGVHTPLGFRHAPGRRVRDRINASLRAVAREMFDDGAMSVDCRGVQRKRRSRHGRSPVGTLTFAPHGDWERQTDSTIWTSTRR